MWQDLKSKGWGISAGAQGADPMLIWAVATQFRDHRFDKRRSHALWFAAKNRNGKFSTQLWTAADYKRNATKFSLVELAEPVVPERPPLRKRGRALPQGKPDRLPRGKSEAPVLVGIIDDGCPFAAQMIRDEAGTGTRVLALWDQDESPAFAAYKGLKKRVPKGFIARMKYGCAISRDGLNRLMRDATQGELVDEELCYRLADYDDVMQGRCSHGAAVMSQLFAEPLYRRSRPLDPSAKKGHVQERSVMQMADLVFVQLPRAAVQDSTSAALARYVIDGLQFMLDCAVAAGIDRLVVNISSGTSRTTHDGRSLLESAITGFVKKAKRAKRANVETHIVVPTGNMNEEQRHAVLNRAGKALELFIPPDCEMPQYVTVRWPKGYAGVKLRVTPPGAVAALDDAVAAGEAKGWPSATKPQCGVVSPLALSDGIARSLIAFAPTTSADRHRTLALSGRWKIELVDDSGVLATKRPTEPEPVSFWISRNQRNLGAVLRGKQARFVDWDESHVPDQAFSRRPENADTHVKNGIRRSGAISGMATAKVAVAVGGYVLDPKISKLGKRSAYSGMPSAGQRNVHMAPSDTNSALPGLYVHGNRSGEVARVIGTSFAAPLIARAIAVKVAKPRMLKPLRLRKYVKP